MKAYNSSGKWKILPRESPCDKVRKKRASSRGSADPTAEPKPKPSGEPGRLNLVNLEGEPGEPPRTSVCSELPRVIGYEYDLIKENSICEKATSIHLNIDDNHISLKVSHLL